MTTIHYRNAPAEAAWSMISRASKAAALNGEIVVDKTRRTVHALVMSRV